MQRLVQLYNKYVRGELDWTAIPYTPQKFEIDDPAAVEYLNEYGYVVFKNVATQEEIEKARGLFWDWAESVRGWEGEQVLKRDDPATWGNESGFWPGDRYNGIVARNGIGQSPFLWYCRTIPKVKQIFSLVWDGEDDLLTSFDGCGVFRPVEYDPEWTTYGSWFHIDQNVYNKPGRHAVQGLLNLYPSGPDDGGFVAIPRSSVMIDEAFASVEDICSKKKGDFVPIRTEAQWWVDRRRAATNEYDFRPVKLCVDEGDFILWDSRCVHCNNPAGAKGGEEAKTRLKRLTAYICMTPTRLAKNLDELILQRVHSFQTGVGSTHWPHEYKPTSQANAEKFPVGAPHVKLTREQAKLITGNKSEMDVYEKFDYSTVKFNLD